MIACQLDADRAKRLSKGTNNVHLRDALKATKDGKVKKKKREKKKEKKSKSSKKSRKEKKRKRASASSNSSSGSDSDEKRSCERNGSVGGPVRLSEYLQGS